MTLPVKVQGKLVKFNYRNGINAVETLAINTCNHRQIRCPCIPQALRDLVNKFQETGCICDRPWFERPTVPVDSIMTVHHIVTSGYMQTAKGVTRVAIPKTTVLKLLHSAIRLFLNRYQHVQMLVVGNHQKRTEYLNSISYPIWGRKWLTSSHIMTDKIQFNLTGNFNTKKCLYCAGTNPYVVSPVSL